jgi:hypothetical protein
LTEKGEIKRDGGRPHRNSGRGILEKGDASVGPFCVDYKEYDEGFTVSRTVWLKTCKDALRMRAVPALRLVLGSKDAPVKMRLWVISDDMFKEMLQAWEEKYE